MEAKMIGATPRTPENTQFPSKKRLIRSLSGREALAVSMCVPRAPLLCLQLEAVISSFL
jgi:hypothetical protein